MILRTKMDSVFSVILTLHLVIYVLPQNQAILGGTNIISISIKIKQPYFPRVNHQRKPSNIGKQGGTNMRTEPSINILAGYCRGKGDKMLILIVTILIIYYEPNAHLTLTSEPVPKKMQRMLARFNFSISMFPLSFQLCSLKKKVFISQKFCPTEAPSMATLWRLGNFIKFSRKREIRFNEVRKKSQHSNLTWV